jgi:(2Fe-2S) ferredoxin
VYLSQKGCAGRCNLEPTVEVIEDGKIRSSTAGSPLSAPEIIDRHLKKGDYSGMGHLSERIFL